MSKRRRFFEEAEDDPTTGIINMTDLMLVLAVGFLVFAIMAMNNNPSLMSQATASKTSTSTVSVSTGQELNDTPENSSGSSSNYQQMGTVYKDPTTGKLIMVS